MHIWAINAEKSALIAFLCLCWENELDFLKDTWGCRVRLSKGPLGTIRFRKDGNRDVSSWKQCNT